MRRLHSLSPNYGFDSPKGYSTPAHFEALNQFGVCPLHRRSFEPVRLAGEYAFTVA